MLHLNRRTRIVVHLEKFVAHMLAIAFPRQVTEVVWLTYRLNRKMMGTPRRDPSLEEWSSSQHETSTARGVPAKRLKGMTLLIVDRHAQWIC